MKKVLYLTIDGLTDPLGQSQILPYLQALSKLGHKITVLSLEKEKRFRSNEKYVIDICLSAGIQWFYLNYSNKIPLLSQFFNYRNLRKLASQKCSDEKYDFIHCRSYLPAMIGENLKNRFSLKFLFDMRGFWPDERVEGKIWKKSNPLHRLIYTYFKQKEKQLLQAADGIIVLTYRAKSYIQTNFYKVNAEKIAVIPCSTDLTLFNSSQLKEEEMNKVRARLCIPNDKTVLSYIGSVGTWYMLDEMIDFFKILNRAQPAHFLIVSQDDKNYIERALTSKGIDLNSVSIVNLERLEVPYAIRLSDFSIFFIRPSFSKIASSPTKLGEILAMGVPVVTNSGVGDVDEILVEGGCGFLLKDFSKQEMSRIIQLIPRDKNSMKIKCREAAESKFSLRNAVFTYNEMYERL